MAAAPHRKGSGTKMPWSSEELTVLFSEINRLLRKKGTLKHKAFHIVEFVTVCEEENCAALLSARTRAIPTRTRVDLGKAQTVTIHTSRHNACHVSNLDVSVP